MNYQDIDNRPDDFLPLRDVVFKQIRKAILTGELRPGERLMEIHLAQKLGVSRTPIREAIRMLELEGLVIMIPRRGAEVARITEKNMVDVLEVRRALDLLSVELACSRINEAGRALMEKACADFEKAISDGDLHAIAEMDVAFHNSILEIAGNARLFQMVSSLAEQMYRYRFEYIKDKTKHAGLANEHAMIAKSIAGGDMQEAMRLTRMHIDNQETAILSRIHLDQYI